MPRAADGTYSLPVGNPVTTLTVISSSWANTTMSGLSSAMTDSLSRSGDGGMTAPLKLDDGLIGAPGLSWGAETISGWYRASAGNFRYSISAADLLQLRTNVFQVSGTAPRSILNESDAAAEEKLWDLTATGGDLIGRTRTDADGAGATWLQVTRTGAAIDAVVLTVTTGGSNSLTVGNALGGITAINGAMSAQYLINEANPSYYINESDAALNEKVWRLNAAAGDLVWSTRTDANAGGATFMTVARTGTVVDSITLTATAIALNGTLTIDSVLIDSGTAPGTPTLELSTTRPILVWNETDAAVDNRRWYFDANAEQFRGVAINDANAVSSTWLAVDRTGTTIDSIVFSTSAGTVSFASGMNITSAQPIERFVENDAAANEQIWDFTASSGDLFFRTRTDVDGAGVTWLTATRTGTTVDAISLSATSVSLLGILFTTGSRFEIESTTPIIQLDETDAAANERSWLVVTAAGLWSLATATDAAPQTIVATAIAVNRTGTTVDSIALAATSITATGAFAVTGAITATTSITAGGDVISSAAAPRLSVNETDAAVDNRLWRIGCSAGDLVWGTRNDADNSGVDFMTVERTGTTVDSITFAATTLNLTGLVRNTSAGTPASPSFQIGSARPLIAWFESDAAANNGLWYMEAQAEQFAMAVSNDAGGATANWLVVNRTANTIDSIELAGTLVQISGGLLEVQSASPIFQLDESDAAANERNWLIRSSAGVLAISTATDAAPTTAVANFLTVDRSGTALTIVALSAPTSLTLTTPLLEAPGIHNGTATGATNAIASGTYTPTLTNGANVAASASAVCQYLRVGNVVHVSGSITVDATAAGPTATQLGLSLPIASDFTGAAQLGGAGCHLFGSAGAPVAISADTPNNRASLDWGAITLNNAALTFDFSYVIV